MSDEDDRRFSRRVRAGLFILGLLVGAVTGAIAADLTSTTEPYHVGEGVVFNATNGPEIKVGENVTVDRTWPVTGDTVNLQPAVVVTGDAGASATIRNLSSTAPWFEADALSVGGGNLTFDPAGKPATRVTGDADRLLFTDYEVGDGNDHIVLETTGATTLEVSGMPDAEVAYLVDSNGDVVDTAYIEGDTAELSTSSSDTYSIDAANVTFEPDPPDGAHVDTQTDVELTVTVEHPDLDAGNDITVEFYNATDDSLIGSDTTSTGEASVTWTGTFKGEHEWYVEVDGIRSDTWSFTTPHDLSVWGENDGQQGLLLDFVDELTVTFFTDEEILTENITGTAIVNMTGLPPDETVYATASAKGYHSRTIVIPDITEPQRMYLLDDVASTITTEFELQDFTGAYPEDDSILEIQRNINGSWERVISDSFGATGVVTAVLEEDVRHRLIIHNIADDIWKTRVVGHFVPTTDGTRTISIEPDYSITIEGVGATTRFSPAIHEVPSTENATVRVDVLPTFGEFQSWTVTVTHVNETSEMLLDKFTSTDPEGGVYEREFNLTGLDGELRVDVSWHHAEGFTGTRSADFGIVDAAHHRNSLVAIADSFIESLPMGSRNMFAHVVAVFLSLLGAGMVASQFAMSSEEVGLVAIGFMAAFATLGWLPWAAIFAAGVAWVAFAAVIRGL